VRDQLGHWAEATGTRQVLARGRDALVDVLTGNGTDPGVRQNRRDDQNLRLLLRFGLRPTSNFLDVGANQGRFLRGLDVLAPGGHHIAYEPLPHLWQKLAQNFPTVEVRNKALSDEDGEAEFVHVLAPGHQGLSGLAEGGFDQKGYPPGEATRTILVSTERLDGHRPDGWLPDFVKIDVEGAEILVFRGAIETFTAAKPVIAFEHSYHPEHTAEMYTLVHDALGLRLFDMDGNGPLGRSHFLEATETRWNWVAHE
jgi:FkbM family methyltransferase